MPRKTYEFQYKNGVISILVMTVNSKKEELIKIHNIDEMCEIIRTWKVPSSSLIGIAAAYALAQHVELINKPRDQFIGQAAAQLAAGAGAAAAAEEVDDNLMAKSTPLIFRFIDNRTSPLILAQAGKNLITALERATIPNDERNNKKKQALVHLRYCVHRILGNPKNALQEAEQILQEEIDLCALNSPEGEEPPEQSVIQRIKCRPKCF